MLKKIARMLTRSPATIILIAVLLLVPSLYGALNTKINYDILSYLPPDLDSTKGQIILEDTFHNAASAMLIIDGMPEKDVEKLKEKIIQVENVNDAIWVSDLMDISIPQQILPQELHDAFYSKKTGSTMIMIKFDDSGASAPTMKAIDDIRALCNKQCFLSGFSIIIKDTRDLADGEMPLYTVLAVIMSIVAMMLTMESWILPLVYIIGIGFAVAYNFGTNMFLGQISYVTKAIAAILQLGVSMDYSIFLVDRYDEEKEKFADRRDAMASAIEGAFISLAGSSGTTIAGFLALCAMRLLLGRDIGIVMAKGVIIGILTVLIVLPSLVIQLDKPIHRWRHRTLVPDFTRLNNFIVKHHRVFVTIFLVLFLPAFYAQSNTKVYYNLDETLPKDLPSIVATNKLKDEFNMASTHFVIVDDTLPAAKLTSMAKEVEKVDGIETVLAYNKFVGPSVPDSFIPQNIKDACKKNGKQMLMINSRYKAAMDEENRQIDEMTAIIKKYDPTAVITGEGAMTKDLIEIASVDFTVTNYLSIAAILLLVAICFKSFTVPIVLVAAIELSIFINLGAPYLTGEVIPFITPTVIGCVQLGATVDYAILMTTRFQEELRSGLDRISAIKAAANAADRSILTSALVFFCATFGVSLISKIEIIKNICSTLARGAIISALVSMFILPSVLLACEKLFSKTSYHWKTTGAAVSKQ
ncbi:MMPL family transporter [Oscillospiraceae bacterium PP1C4]